MKRRLFAVGAGGVLGVLLSAAVAVAQPQPPASFYGTASIDGKPVADGTEVRAFVGEKDCTQPGARGTLLEGGASVYVVAVMHESQAAGCGVPGRPVTFRVGGRATGQTAAWQSGLQQLDLNVGTGQPLPLPSVTAGSTSVADVAATATEAAKFTPKAGTPPTDEAGPVTVTVAGRQPPPASGGEASGVSPLLILGAGVAVLSVLAAAGGVAMSRRRPGPGTTRDEGGS